MTISEPTLLTSNEPIFSEMNFRSSSVTVAEKKSHLSGIFTGEKTLHVVAVARDGDLKRWKDFY